MVILDPAPAKRGRRVALNCAAMKHNDPRTRILETRLKRWRERLAAAEARGDDPAYVANCRTEIERLQDQLATKKDLAE